MPCDIPAGGEATFYVSIAVLNENITIAEKLTGQPQRIVFEIWNAHREYRTEPSPAKILAVVST
jgi:propanediol dehydratase small subunit